MITIRDMMQGGDPQADGYGGNKDADGNEINITDEFTANGSDNNLSHTAGAISMARGDDYDSASSQFFIVHTNDYTGSLDGQYAVFGYVTEGMDIVDAICSATYSMDENETIDAAEQPVITSITICEVNESSESDDNAENETDETKDSKTNTNTDTEGENTSDTENNTDDTNTETDDNDTMTE